MLSLVLASYLIISSRKILLPENHELVGSIRRRRVYNAAECCSGLLALWRCVATRSGRKGNVAS